MSVFEEPVSTISREGHIERKSRWNHFTVQDTDVVMAWTKEAALGIDESYEKSWDGSCMTDGWLDCGWSDFSGVNILVKEAGGPRLWGPWVGENVLGGCGGTGAGQWESRRQWVPLCMSWTWDAVAYPTGKSQQWMATWVRNQKCRLDSYPHVSGPQGKKGDHTGRVYKGNQDIWSLRKHI